MNFFSFILDSPTPGRTL